MWDMKPGMQVICIEDDWWIQCPIEYPLTAPPVRGQIYTIRDIILFPPPFIGLRFEELINGPGPAGKEYSFTSSKFRPVKPTDISSLRALLRSPAPPAVPQKILEILRRG